MYEQLLRSKGLKSTPQRLMALKAIQEGGHIDIDQLHDSFNRLGMKIPLATLYRILGELSSVGILHTVTLSGQKTRYEIAKGDHPHFLCEQCGQLEDLHVAMDEIATIAQNACVHSTRSVSVMLHGICQNCSSIPDKTRESEG
ncbi:MAG: transcriptional repressor [Sulfuricurvum sp.]|jgi:Fe2+ or Zn2+ uptake regulation protein|uniref:Fur family transcriptional regulator n=1 Tax=Sulfuricurvum sp. TaxID=2025608 RepID=UPI0025D2C4D7|nr:Fur family transcriptional regulator [Sulfuricurvum sp.]MCK9372342.1 transcriptional repressor [Sulfuricurvum sp.]